MTTTIAPRKPATLEELIDGLGNVPLSRVLMAPAPGMASESDVVESKDRLGRLCELVDGTLVEKAMGFRESMLGMDLGRILLKFVRARNLGLVSGPDGMVRLFPGLVRGPDVAFVSWDRLPERKVPRQPIPNLVPDLAVEILSPSNTPAEMTRKRGEYFAAGVRLVWIIDPEWRAVSVYTPDDEVRVLDATRTLDGGDVLPGFTLDPDELFAELDRHG